MNGIIYCRVSSKDQVDGTSLESQESACRDFARAKHITVLKVFVEQGESAKFADRTQLLELLDFCKQNKGRVQALLIWKIDRFARNVQDHYSLKATLFKFGVQIMSVTEPIDNDPNGKLMETILAGFAQFDNDIRAMRTVQGMRRKLQEGIFPWKAPLGYLTSATDGEKKTEPDRPDPAVFPLLLKAWHAFATGAYTKAEIGRLLETWGVRTQAGRPVSSQSLDHLFANPFYAGILVDPWSGAEHEGRHIPLVSREEFAYVQQIISRRNRSVPHQSMRSEFSLRRTVRCPSCQHFLTGSISRGRSQRYSYYFCYNRHCFSHRKSHRAHNVHEEFEAFLANVVIEPKLLDQVADVITATAAQEAGLLKARRVRSQAKVDAVNRELKELIHMRARDLIGDEEFTKQRASLHQQRLTLEAAGLTRPFANEQLQSDVAIIKAPASNLGGTWHRLPPPLRRRFVQFLLPVGFVHTRIRTAELGLLFRLSNGFHDGNPNAAALIRKCWNQLLEEIRGFANLIQEYQAMEGPSKETVPTDPH